MTVVAQIHIDVPFAKTYQICVQSWPWVGLLSNRKRVLFCFLLLLFFIFSFSLKKMPHMQLHRGVGCFFSQNNSLCNYDDINFCYSWGLRKLINDRQHEKKNHIGANSIIFEIIGQLLKNDREKMPVNTLIKLKKYWIGRS